MENLKCVPECVKYEDERDIYVNGIWCAKMS